MKRVPRASTTRAGQMTFSHEKRILTRNILHLPARTQSFSASNLQIHIHSHRKGCATSQGRGIPELAERVPSELIGVAIPGRGHECSVGLAGNIATSNLALSVDLAHMEFEGGVEGKKRLSQTG